MNEGFAGAPAPLVVVAVIGVSLCAVVGSAIGVIVARQSFRAVLKFFPLLVLSVGIALSGRLVSRDAPLGARLMLPVLSILLLAIAASRLFGHARRLLGSADRRTCD